MCTHSLDTCFSSGATSAQENLNSFLRDPPTAAGWKPINQEVHQDKCVQNFLISEFKKQNQEKGKSPVGFCHLRLGFLSQILSSLKSLRYDLASLREHFFVCFVLVFGGCQGLFVFFFFLSLRAAPTPLKFYLYISIATVFSAEFSGVQLLHFWGADATSVRNKARTTVKDFSRHFGEIISWSDGKKKGRIIIRKEVHIFLDWS